MTVREAAAILEVTIGTVYALCRSGLLAHTRVGLRRGTIRITQQDLDAYVASRRVEATPAVPTVEEQGTGLAVRDIVGEELSKISNKSHPKCR